MRMQNTGRYGARIGGRAAGVLGKRAQEGGRRAECSEWYKKRRIRMMMRMRMRMEETESWDYLGRGGTGSGQRIGTAYRLDKQGASLRGVVCWSRCSITVTAVLMETQESAALVWWSIVCDYH
jgi:hypothetical protein